MDPIPDSDREEEIAEEDKEKEADTAEETKEDNTEGGKETHPEVPSLLISDQESEAAATISPQRPASVFTSSTKAKVERRKTGMSKDSQSTS